MGGIFSEGYESFPVMDPDSGLTIVGIGFPFVGTGVEVTAEFSKAEMVNCRLAMVACFCSGDGVAVWEGVNIEHMMDVPASDSVSMII
jgi:hypothetical protein